MGKKAKRIKELEKENEELKKSVVTFAGKLANAFEQSNASQRLKQANEATRIFLESHASKEKAAAESWLNLLSDLQGRLDKARDRIESLFQFLVTAANRIGYLERVLEESDNPRISRGTVFCHSFPR